MLKNEESYYLHQKDCVPKIKDKINSRIREWIEAKLGWMHGIEPRTVW
jgi:hypothetical protein